jgi:hypothetical protein
MNNEDGLLDFLTDGLIARERDAVTRAYYGYATGDPNSEPVGIAVLLTACARIFARTPERLKTCTTEFQKAAEDARTLEKGLIDRVRRENSSVVSAVKDEMHRAVTTWNETITRAMRTEEIARSMGDDFKPVIAAATQIAGDFKALKGDLKVHAESATAILKAAEAIKAMRQEDQMRFKHLTKQARADWISIGLLGGIVLSNVLSDLAWWAVLIVLGATIGLIQAVSRYPRKTRGVGKSDY